MRHDVRAEIVGTVVRVSVALGDLVSIGDEVAVIESMKMEIPVEATAAGRVADICVEAGDVVQEGATIVAIHFD